MVTRSVGADDGLSSERRYASRTLPQGVARGLADAAARRCHRARPAGAIVAGLAAVTAGYVTGTVSNLAERRGQRSIAGRPR